MSRLRLEFENQCTRLNAHLEYEQDQLEQQKKKHQKMEEMVSKEEKAIVEQKKVVRIPDTQHSRSSM